MLDKLLKFLSFTIIIFIGIAGIYSLRGLYADGSYWLVEMLPRGGFYIFDPHREFVQRLVQLPVAVAIWSGSLDLNLLIRLHNFGFVGTPLIFWLGSLFLQFRNSLFWLFLMAFSVSYLRSNFFAAGEFSVAYAMTAFCASILLLHRIRPLHALLLLLTSVLLIRSYEATLFLGFFLALLTCIRLFKVQTDTTVVRFILIFSIFTFFASMYVGGRSVFHERSYDGSSTANIGALKEIHLLYLVLLPILITTLVSRYFIRVKYFISFFVIVLVAMYLVYAFRWDHSNISYGYLSYAYRALCCFLMLFIFALATIIRFWPEQFKALPLSLNNNQVSITATVFFLSMAVLLLFHTYGYYKWIKQFERVAVSLTSNISIDKAGISKNYALTSDYNWGWGNPSTSILMRGNAEAMVLNNSSTIGTEPGDFENTRENDSFLNTSRPESWTYRLKPFIKNGLLFP